MSLTTINGNLFLGSDLGTLQMKGLKNGTLQGVQ
ncbi:hypothetical protein BofuT4_uP027380.1 [Botrytis cinerea T4]|uniref:Uncharacterized protein n=1 Tax=Botryotinia fuckeliana (strain T4) TaxID=999810 RepID=G2Y9Z1_BOTF4|nr:hypothetical protein BofuT4_uP027380.1 [Botrytis cinerea T4]